MVIIVILLLAGCIPAKEPPQLAYTPGPAVQVVDAVYDSGVFRVQHPPEWQVVTSAADQTPPSVIFAAPEGDALIMVGQNLTAAPAPAGYSGAIRSERREVRLEDGVVISLILNAPPEKWSAYRSLFDAVVESVRAS